MSSTDHIDQIVDASAEAARAQARLRETVQAAVRAGLAVSEVAAAAGVTRQTVYRWADQGRAVKVDLRETLDQALVILGAMIGPTNASAVRARVGGTPEQQMLGLKMGLSSLQPGDLDALDEEERGIITTAQEAVAAARRHRETHGDWPKRVTLG